MGVVVPAGIERRLIRPPAAAVFTEAELDGLPSPVRRYLRYAIAEGTPLASTARLHMRGHIKLGRWLRSRPNSCSTLTTAFTGGPGSPGS